MTYYEQLLTDLVKDVIRPENAMRRQELLAGYARLLEIHETVARNEEIGNVIALYNPADPSTFMPEVSKRLDEIMQGVE